MPLFEVVILEKSTEGTAVEGGEERLVYGPEFIVAKDAYAAELAILLGKNSPILVGLARQGMSAVRAGRITVLVRPFAGCRV